MIRRSSPFSFSFFPRFLFAKAPSFFSADKVFKPKSKEEVNREKFKQLNEEFKKFQANQRSLSPSINALQLNEKLQQKNQKFDDHLYKELKSDLETYFSIWKFENPFQEQKFLAIFQKVTSFSHPEIFFELPELSISLNLLLSRLRSLKNPQFVIQFYLIFRFFVQIEPEKNKKSPETKLEGDWQLIFFNWFRGNHQSFSGNEALDLLLVLRGDIQILEASEETRKGGGLMGKLNFFKGDESKRKELMEHIEEFFKLFEGQILLFLKNHKYSVIQYALTVLNLYTSRGTPDETLLSIVVSYVQENLDSTDPNMLLVTVNFATRNNHLAWSWRKKILGAAAEVIEKRVMMFNMHQIISLALDFNAVGGDIQKTLQTLFLRAEELIEKSSSQTIAKFLMAMNTIEKLPREKAEHMAYLAERKLRSSGQISVGAMKDILLSLSELGLISKPFALYCYKALVNQVFQMDLEGLGQALHGVKIVRPLVGSTEVFESKVIENLNGIILQNNQKRTITEAEWVSLCLIIRNLSPESNKSQKFIEELEAVLPLESLSIKTIGKLLWCIVDRFSVTKKTVDEIRKKVLLHLEKGVPESDSESEADSFDWFLVVWGFSRFEGFDFGEIVKVLGTKGKLEEMIDEIDVEQAVSLALVFRDPQVMCLLTKDTVENLLQRIKMDMHKLREPELSMAIAVFSTGFTEQRDSIHGYFETIEVLYQRLKEIRSALTTNATNEAESES